MTSLSKKLLIQALDHADSPVCILQNKDSQEVIVHANNSFCKLLGSSLKEVVHKTIDQYTVNISPVPLSIAETESLIMNQYNDSLGDLTLCETTPNVISFSNEEGEFLICRLDSSVVEENKAQMVSPAKEETDFSASINVVPPLGYNQEAQTEEVPLHVEDQTFTTTTDVAPTDPQEPPLATQPEPEEPLEEGLAPSMSAIQFLQNFPEVVWECDANMNLTYIGGALQSLTGFTPESLLYEPLYSRFDQNSRDKIQEQITLPNTNTIRCGGLICYTADNSELCVELVFRAAQNAKQEPCWIGMLREDFSLALMPAEESQADEVIDDSQAIIHVNSEGMIFFASESSQAIIGFNPDEAPQEITPYLVDETIRPMIDFAFMQQEDVPFPVELKFQNTAQQVFLRFYEDHLEASFDEVLEVQQTSEAEASDEMDFSDTIDPDMKANILSDSKHLAGETLELVRSLEVCSYSNEEELDLEEYRNFIDDKNIDEYRENIRLLANKVHGLKGASGFLIPAAKKLCHYTEEIIKPLSECKLVLTQSNFQLLKQFVFAIQESLDEFEEGRPISCNVHQWEERIQQQLHTSQKYVGNQIGEFISLLVQAGARNTDQHSVRADEFLSVSHQGYLQLAEQVKQLFYMIVDNLSGDSLVNAGTLYNEFLGTHQKIIKIAPDLSRYERLIPNMGSEYDKQVNFEYNTHETRADREFWNAMHEVFNHVLKNAIIHGLETPSERIEQNKPECGVVNLDINDDALNLYIKISDDGRGIDVDQISQKAVENQIISQEDLKKMSKEEILGLVFAQGVSTADQVDDNAGRGVGMNAVQEVMKQFRGSCTISSDLNIGTSWSFIFPKNNVSLPCFIVKIGEMPIAIPENNVEGFQKYQQNYIHTINQRKVYRRNEEVIPLLDSRAFFGDDNVHEHQNIVCRLLILQENSKKVGLAINDILHHATLPILALPSEYQNIPIYLGATLYRDVPVLVLNAHQIFTV